MVDLGERNSNDWLVQLPNYICPGSAIRPVTFPDYNLQEIVIVMISFRITVSLPTNLGIVSSLQPSEAERSFREANKLNTVSRPGGELDSSTK